jgi:integrase
MAAAGIEVRHRNGCRSLSGGRCNCEPSYRAMVWSRRDGEQIRKSFPTLDAAKAWRNDALSALRKGAMRRPVRRKLKDAAAEWLRGAEDGSIRNRSGDRYKPSAVRGYHRALRLRVLPALGDALLSDIQRNDLQDFVDGMVGKGLSPSTIDCTLNPLRAIYRRAVSRGELAVNPTRELERPAIRSAERRFASPAEARALIEALPDTDRPLWATAFYSGLRRGELMALDWSRVDLGSGLIRVEASWDDKEGLIAPKTKQGRRRVPIPGVSRSMAAGMATPA